MKKRRKLSRGARIRVTMDDYSHQTHEKTRNIVFIFVEFSGFRGQEYPMKEIKFFLRLDRPFFGRRLG